MLFIAVFATHGSPSFAADWVTTDMGAVGTAGSAVKNADVWTVRGAGSDIWGDEDSFLYLNKLAYPGNGHLDVRLDSQTATHPFAKAGLMLRGTSEANPSSSAVILDVKPNNEVEFMHRRANGDVMVYDTGVVVSLPAWLQLSWAGSNTTPGCTTYTVTASVSQDGTTWSALGTAPMSVDGCVTMHAGVAVLSHDPAQLNVARFEGLSMLPAGWTSTDIGATGLRGSASADPENLDLVWTIDGAGADVWGESDSFHFVHTTTNASGLTDYQVLRITNTQQFAKAGLMIRDGVAPDAVTLIFDVKPDGGVEFMARTCRGCPMQFLAGTTITLPMDLVLSRDGATSTFSASVEQFGNPPTRRLVGSVTLPIGDTFEFGFAVTSHDVSRLNTAAFDHPPQ